MDIIYIGIFLLGGFFLAFLFQKSGLPRILGFLATGLLLNPELTDIISTGFLENTNYVVNFCLAFITFEIGSSFTIDELKKAGKRFFSLAFFEAFGAFVFVLTGFLFLSGWILPDTVLSMPMVVSFSLLLASLAAPTDPSATLAVIHEYRAEGPVAKTILGTAAFDDIITLVLFSFSLSVSRSLTSANDLNVWHIILHILYKISGAIATGVVAGFILNKTVEIFKVIEKKHLVVLFLGFLSLTFGTTTILNMDELFSTLTLGFMVSNFSVRKQEFRDITEQGLEELFFLIFFVFNAMSFKFAGEGMLIVIAMSAFIIIRALGKYTGMQLGSGILKMDGKVKKYAYMGLIPQGGIVLGLSLMLSNQPEFHGFSNILMGIVMGATIVHEFFGPLLAKFALRRSGETRA